VTDVYSSLGRNVRSKKHCTCPFTVPLRSAIGAESLTTGPAGFVGAVCACLRWCNLTGPCVVMPAEDERRPRASSQPKQHHRPCPRVFSPPPSFRTYRRWAHSEFAPEDRITSSERVYFVDPQAGASRPRRVCFCALRP
jgi:hypothetical protein